MYIERVIRRNYISRAARYLTMVVTQCARQRARAFILYYCTVIYIMYVYI